MLLSICLIFYEFQPGVAYKSVAYKKECNYSKETWNNERQIYYKTHDRVDVMFLMLKQINEAKIYNMRFFS